MHSSLSAGDRHCARGGCACGCCHSSRRCTAAGRGAPQGRQQRRGPPRRRRQGPRELRALARRQAKGTSALPLPDIKNMSELLWLEVRFDAAMVILDLTKESHAAVALRMAGTWQATPCTAFIGSVVRALIRRWLGSLCLSFFVRDSESE